MKKSLPAALLLAPLLFVCANARAQEATLKLEDSTPVKLRLQRNVSSADAQVGDKIDFDVLDEIAVSGIVVIPKGSIAWGTVTEAQAKRRMARGGKLDINIDSARLADGEKCALRAVKDMKGGGHTGAMTAGMVATGIIIWPAAPFFLFMHGKDITIPEGTEITAYINGDMKLDPAKFASAAPPPTGTTPAVSATAAARPAPAAASIAVAVSSAPDGADITVDGKFVGSTPSSLQLTSGDHVITIEKSGYKAWQRTITLTAGGSPTINPTLDKQSGGQNDATTPGGNGPGVSTETTASGQAATTAETPATVNCRGTHGLALFAEPTAQTIIGTFACGESLSVLKTGVGSQSQMAEVLSTQGRHGYVNQGFLDLSTPGK